MRFLFLFTAAVFTFLTHSGSLNAAIAWTVPNPTDPSTVDYPTTYPTTISGFPTIPPGSKAVKRKVLELGISHDIFYLEAYDTSNPSWRKGLFILDMQDNELHHRILYSSTYTLLSPGDHIVTSCMGWSQIIDFTLVPSSHSNYRAASGSNWPVGPAIGDFEVQNAVKWFSGGESSNPNSLQRTVHKSSSYKKRLTVGEVDRDYAIVTEYTFTIPTVEVTREANGVDLYQNMLDWIEVEFSTDSLVYGYVFRFTEQYYNDNPFASFIEYDQGINSDSLTPYSHVLQFATKMPHDAWLSPVGNKIGFYWQDFFTIPTMSTRPWTLSYHE